MFISFSKNFSFKNLIGLSLILSSSYYFFVRRFFFIDLEKIVVQSFVLFIFSLLLFFLILKFLDIFCRKFNKKEFLNTLIICIFFTWLLVQSLKAIFFVANYITLAEFISKIFLLETLIEYELPKRVVIYSIPYFVSFIFVFLSRNKLFKYLNFFVVLGYVLFALLSYDLAKKVLSNQFFISHKSYLATEKKEIHKERKVIWILFDEFDPEIAFSYYKNDNFMKNFKEFKNNSFTHSEMFSPAKSTLLSVPAQLVGTQIVGTLLKKNTLVLRTDELSSVDFSYENTIFGRLEKMGFDSSILSSVLPYCSMLKKNKKCIQPNGEWYKGIIFVFPLFSKIKLFFKLLNHDKNVVEDLVFIENIDTNKYIHKIRDTDGQNTVNFKILEKHINSSSDFIFIHILMPHLPANMGFGDPSNYAESIFNIKVSGNDAAYKLNLKLTDIILKKVLNFFHEKSDEERLLILSSDHWFRIRDQKKAHPILFMAKIKNDNSKVEIRDSDSAIYIQELIEEFLSKKISTHSDIKMFFEKKPFHKTYIAE